jgi:hypothetical protein
MAGRLAGLVALAATGAILALVPSGAGASAHPQLFDFGCGSFVGAAPAVTAHVGGDASTDGLSEPGLAKAYRQALRREKQDPDAAAGARATALVRIPVYVHVIQEDATSGFVSDALIDAQMNVLNAGYAGAIAPGGENTGIVFGLVDTDRTIKRRPGVSVTPGTAATGGRRTRSLAGSRLGGSCSASSSG